MEHKTLEERVESLEQCQIKMAQQVEEMYQMFTSANWMIKFILKLFAAIGMIAGAIIGIYEVYKRFK